MNPHIVMGDCIEIENVFLGQSSINIPTIDTIGKECNGEWVMPDMVRNRANQSLSRKKAYKVESKIDPTTKKKLMPFYGIISLHLSFLYFFLLQCMCNTTIGKYTGAIAGHSMATELSSE